jgi:hypothetical protein
MSCTSSRACSFQYGICNYYMTMSILLVSPAFICIMKQQSDLYWKEQNWKGVLFGVHLDSKRILCATSQAVTSAGCFTDHVTQRNCTLRLLSTQKE